MLKLRADVQIVPLSKEHAAQTLKWLQDPNILKNLGLRKTPSLERTIQWNEEAQNSSEIHAFAILVGETYVGNVVLDRTDDLVSTTRFHIFIGENNLRNAGVGRTATHLICRFAFEKLELNKVWLIVHSKNFRAITTYAHLGFKLEGILREEFLYEDERIDVLYMGLLKKDFESNKVYLV